ncbi:hypothetical protein [Tsuneonella mangrovi]|uniref:hypothetical protein n=1 Tax=Tsuneonella mangrovi TaxID=1982042 RepID=UPI001F0A8D55|nr:hypothetical protein [Tsuneonella mangrovi]
MIRAIAPLAATFLLAACGAAVPTHINSASPPQRNNPARTPKVTYTPATRPPPPAGDGFVPPQVMRSAGLEGVIGANKAALEREFGTPRLDVWEGDARKLQFSGEACVLDVYLYPLKPGAEPTATYVDARRASDGLDVDRAACVRALKR